MQNVTGAIVVIIIGFALALISDWRRRNGKGGEAEESPLMQQADKVLDQYRDEMEKAAAEQAEIDAKKAAAASAAQDEKGEQPAQDDVPAPAGKD